MLKYLSKLFNIIEDWAGAISLALLMLVLAVQVFGRAVGFGASLAWTDECARFLFVWSVFLSLPFASKKGAMVHIKLTEKLMPSSLKALRPKIATGLWALSALFFAILSMANILARADFPQLTPILGLNQNHLMLVVPLSFAMVFVRSGWDFFNPPAIVAATSNLTPETK